MIILLRFLAKNLQDCRIASKIQSEKPKFATFCTKSSKQDIRYGEKKRTTLLLIGENTPFKVKFDKMFSHTKRRNFNVDTFEKKLPNFTDKDWQENLMILGSLLFLYLKTTLILTYFAKVGRSHHKPKFFCSILYFLLKSVE
jgi:hypothetical protein